MRQFIDTLLVMIGVLAICFLITFFFGSCTRIARQLEKQLECDEEVHVDFKFKVDVESAEERAAEINDPN